MLTKFSIQRCSTRYLELIEITYCFITFLDLPCQGKSNSFFKCLLVILYSRLPDQAKIFNIFGFLRNSTSQSKCRYFAIFDLFVNLYFFTNVLLSISCKIILISLLYSLWQRQILKHSSHDQIIVFQAKDNAMQQTTNRITYENCHAIMITTLFAPFNS